MVADKVEINTRSYKEGSSLFFGLVKALQTYHIGKGTRENEDTEITLYLNKDSDEYLEESKLSMRTFLYSLLLFALSHLSW